MDIKNNENIKAALAEIERINEKFGKDSWQAAKASQMKQGPKGAYYARLTELAEQQKARKDKAFAACKTAEEYEYWELKIVARYHADRLKAYNEYLAAVNAKVPTQLGEPLIIPEQKKTKKNNYRRW